MLFLGHPLRSRLDLLKPDVRTTVENQQASQMQYRGRKALVSKERSFQPGDHVLARDYRGNGNKWIHSVIKNRLGSVSYSVEPNDGNGVLWRRHIEQLKKCHVPANQEELLSNVPQGYPDLVTQNYDHVSDNQVIVDPTSDNEYRPTKSVQGSVSQEPVAVVPIQEKRYTSRVQKPPQRLIDSM